MVINYKGAFTLIELPESHTLSKQLDQQLKGLEICGVIAGHSPHGFAFYSGDPQDYEELLNGKRISSTRALGGMVEISAANMRILFADGVNLRLLEQAAPLPKKHQLLLIFSSGQKLVCTIQMYGGLWVFQEGENNNPYYLVAQKKPTPLTQAFSAEYFSELFSETKATLSAKAFLATEQRIPGLGNGVLQDILFDARIHPKTKIKDLSSGETERMYQSVKSVLVEMTRLGGRDTEKDIFGRPGGYHTVLSRITLERPCPVCGGILERKAFLGGNIYYCPICQPMK